MRRNDPYGLGRFDDVWRRILDERDGHRPPPPRPVPPPPPPRPGFGPPPPPPMFGPPMPGRKPCCSRAVRFHPHERRG